MRKLFKKIRTFLHDTNPFTDVDAGLFLRFQLLSKTIYALILLPVYKMVLSAALYIAGRDTISSGDYWNFLFSWQGFGLALVSFFFLLFVVALDVAAFLIAAKYRQQGTPLKKARVLLIKTLREVPRFFHLTSLVLVVYCVLIVPLVGQGPNISGLSWVKIPNFILQEIENNPLYSIGYLLVLVLLLILAIYLSLFLPALFLREVSQKQALISSLRLVHKNFFEVVKDIIKDIFTVAVWVGLSCVLVTLACLGLALVIPSTEFTIRFLVFLWFMWIAIATILGVFINVSIEIRDSAYFYNYLEEKADNPDADFDTQLASALNPERKIVWSLVGTSLALLLGTAGLAALTTVFFDDIFHKRTDIAIIAHRAGGELAAENSLAGVQRAYELGLQYAEIDVQRTKDGHYVLNHDATFTRVAGQSKASSALTLAQVQSFQIKDAFQMRRPAQPVAELGEVLDYAKHRIDLFIELKGATADTQMVDDVVAMLEAKDLSQHAVLVSLDYELIKYIEQTYPHIETGYIYFFAVGDITTLQGDWLIMEEGLASSETVEAVKEAKKKIAVWTVNDEITANNFLTSEIDGIITDKPTMILRTMTANDVEAELEQIVDYFLGM